MYSKCLELHMLGFCTREHFTVHSKPRGSWTSLKLILTLSLWIRWKNLFSQTGQLVVIYHGCNEATINGSHGKNSNSHRCKEKSSWQHKSKNMRVCKVSHSQRTWGTCCGVIRNHDSCSCYILLHPITSYYILLHPITTYYLVLAKDIALVWQ